MLKFTANLSLLFNEVELIQRFKLAKRQGFNAVEIQFPYVLSAQDIDQALKENQQQLILFNVAADDLLQGGEGLACKPEKRHQFRQAIEQTVNYATILKPEAINILPGCCHVTAHQTAYRDTFLENLRYACDIFGNLGIKTVFEAINTIDMPGFIIHNEAQMLAVCNEINHPNLFIQYDIYHMQMMEQKPQAFITENTAAIGHIQFADCPGRAQPGTGQVNFEQLFNTIAASSYSGWTGAEYKPQGSTTESLSWFRARRNP